MRFGLLLRERMCGVRIVRPKVIFWGAYLNLRRLIFLFDQHLECTGGLAYVVRRYPIVLLRMALRVRV